MTAVPPQGEPRERSAFVIWKGRVLIESVQSREPLRATRADFAPAAPLTAVVSDAAGNVAAYVLECDDEAVALAAVRPITPGAAFIEMMFDLGRLGPVDRAALVRAIAIERWSNRYRFCPACGAALIWSTESVAKVCTNPHRVHRHFPRLDPAIIVLVTRGELALLGRSPRFPPGIFSTLAGFVEPGESVEAALRREVFEEAGIRVGATRYFGSEPWPFPRSLMLGFFADAESDAIVLNDAELVEAHWFDRAELAALQARMKRERPDFDTIARRLIDAWLAGSPALNSGSDSPAPNSGSASPAMGSR